MAVPEEEYFVNTFIRKERRDRLRHELNDPKKRHRALDRFSHGTGNLILREKIRLEGETMEKEKRFTEFIAAHAESCRVLSSDSLMEGEIMPLREAIGYAYAAMEAVLILGSSFAIIYGEAMKGGREKYLLAE